MRKSQSPSFKAIIMPCLRYQDAPTAIDWLCRTFDFERHLIVSGPHGTVAHAQLTYENAMIMLGSGIHEGAYGHVVKAPADLGQMNTQTIYMIVENVDAHYARTKAAGAKILIDIKDEDYGGRGYSCFDIEGHVWSFGTYNPWHETEL